MKRKLITLLIILQITSLFSQTTTGNLEKYWNYRNRLKSKFLLSANRFYTPKPHEAGLNIPASIYNPTNFNNNPIEQRSIAKTLKWGDATSHMGYYIAVLATEYALLKQSGQNYIGTVNELIWTLTTLESLDYKAESYYGNGCSEGYYYGNTWINIYPYTGFYCFNGFFVRDDIPQDFIDYWKNNGFPEFSDVNHVWSDSEKPSDNEMSQDQVWDLMFGLALVKKLVDLPNTFNDGEGEMVTLKKWAQKITYRITKFMHGLDDNDAKSWVVRNPVTGNIVKRGGSPTDTYTTAYFLAEAGNWITEKQFGDLHYSGAQEPIWVYPLTVFPRENFYNANCFLNLSSISNIYWGKNVKSLLYHIMSCALYWNSSLPDNKNDCELFAFEHYPMYSIVLHDEIPNDYYFDYYMSFVKTLLDLAPQDGPFRYIYDVNGNGINDSIDYPNREWATDNRLWKPIGWSIKNGEEAGEYNGLDYMVLHNLYWLVNKKVNNKTISVTTNFPFNYDLNGTITICGHKNNQTDFTITSLNKLEANNIINADGKVTYRAKNEIKLKSGFHAKPGSKFHAYIDNFNNLSYMKNSLKNSIENELKIDTLPSKQLKLKQFHHERNKEEHILTSITDDNLKIQVYPNPCSNFIFIKGLSKSSSDKIQFIDSKGMIVKSVENTDDVLEIDVSDLGKGIYFIRIKNENVLKKIIIE